MKRYIFLVSLLLCSSILLDAQQRVIFEKLRYSTPVNYFEDKSAQGNFLSHLNTLLQTHYDATLSDTVNLPLLNAGGNINIFNRQVPLTSADDNTLHLVIDIVEYTPDAYFSSLGLPASDAAESETRSRVRTVIRFMVKFLRADQSVVFIRIKDALVYNTPGTGMGIPSPYIHVLPRTFPGLAKKMADILFNPANTRQQIDIGVAGIFAVDNHFMPLLADQHRYRVNTNENAYGFIYDSVNQIIRRGEPLYEQLMLKGKKAQPYPAAIMDAINRADNRASSDFVFLKQEWRDVIDDHDYQLRLVIQVNPEKDFGLPSRALTGFMPGNLHVLLQNADTIARFTISKYVADMESRVYPYRVYDGIDSSSVYTVGDPSTIWPLKYNYLVRGHLKGRDFEIRCSGVNNSNKEFLLNGQRVAMAQGIFGPDVFAVFDASLPPETLKQLFFIGFNRFFE